MKYIYIYVALLITSISFSQEVDFTKIPQLQTKATYTTSVSPDLITLSITLSEVNTKGKVSVEELENKMKKVLLANEIDLQKQLTLTDLSSNFKDYFLKKTDIQKTKNYQLQVYSAVTAGNVLKGLESQEISNVQLLKTAYSKLEELKIELKGKAVEKAKKQAQEMVKSLHQTLGSAIYISDLQTNISGFLNNKVKGLNVIGYAENQSDDQLQVAFDKIVVDATVSVYFKLEGL
ncbi:SIMPL domain-containing protein [Zhouia sp. PK063]|uniref:SIMPL domain-containing protein n=1 Tax=Zhouia sp. PK063 TaxID=3373602 RepID=UPI0037A64825